VSELLLLLLPLNGMGRSSRAVDAALADVDTAGAISSSGLCDDRRTARGRRETAQEMER
jgi:hypothetical protein